MNKSIPILTQEGPLHSFQWQYDFIANNFMAEPGLVAFLGNKSTTPFTLNQLFDACHSEQVDGFKEKIKNVISSHEKITDYVLINAPMGCYLAKILINYREGKKDTLGGVIKIIEKLPDDLQHIELLTLLFEESNGRVMIADAKHRILLVNKQFCKVAGYLKEELIGEDTKILSLGQYTEDFYQKFWNKVDKDKIWNGELLARNKQGDVYAQETEVQKIIQKNGSYFYVMKSERLDISNYSLIHNQKGGGKKRADIFNKKEFTDKITKEYKELGNTETIVIAAFVVKTQQRSSKNAIQWLISQRFDSYCRGGHLGLINDDIFAICQVVEKSADKIDALLSRTMKELMGGEDADELDAISNIKMATSVLFVDSKTIQQLLLHSVQRLLATPFAEKSSITYYDRRLAKRFNRRQILAKLLQEALNNNKIEVYYQPIVDIKKMVLAKFEALFRVTLDTTLSYNIQELCFISFHFI